MKVKADGEQKVEMENKIYAIPEHIMRGCGSGVSHHTSAFAFHVSLCVCGADVLQIFMH